jgi:hypothetical protein
MVEVKRLEADNIGLKFAELSRGEKRSRIFGEAV